jgi:hypothetical protein
MMLVIACVIGMIVLSILGTIILWILVWIIGGLIIKAILKTLLSLKRLILSNNVGDETANCRSYRKHNFIRYELLINPINCLHYIYQRFNPDSLGVYISRFIIWAWGGKMFNYQQNHDATKYKKTNHQSLIPSHADNLPQGKQGNQPKENLTLQSIVQ